MTLSELRQLVSYYVDDLQQTYFTPTQLNVFLNRAQTEAQKLLVGAGQDYYTRCVQTTLVVNQGEYALPLDFSKLNRLELVISGVAPNENVSVVSNISPNQIDLIVAQSGTPQVYWFQRNRLVIRPFPQVALTMRMVYTYEVADMIGDNSVPDMLEKYHEMIAILAARDCFIKDDRDPSNLLEKLQMYKDMMKADAAQRNIDQSRMVIQTGQYADAEWNLW